MGTEPINEFQAVKAVRERTPLLIGIVSPSGAGKTYSALRLATGIQRVDPRPIYMIDTEARRGLHYAGQFDYQYVDFRPPFDSLRYLRAIEYCAAEGAGTVIVDSMSHEHAGAGGVLEMHEAEVERLAKSWGVDHEKANIPAWSKPKAQRTKLINGIIGLGINFIACFRAKEKIKIVTGKKPVQLGWQAIAGEEFIYEMTLKFWLMPGADGVPTWKSDLPAEQAMMKCPGQFRDLLVAPSPTPQLSEEIGEAVARWSSGQDSETLADRYAACPDEAAFQALEEERKAVWAKLSADEKKRLKQMSEAASRRLSAGAEHPARELFAPGEAAGA